MSRCWRPFSLRSGFALGHRICGGLLPWIIHTTKRRTESANLLCSSSIVYKVRFFDFILSHRPCPMPSGVLAELWLGCLRFTIRRMSGAFPIMIRGKSLLPVDSVAGQNTFCLVPECFLSGCRTHSVAQVGRDKRGKWQGGHGRQKTLCLAIFDLGSGGEWGLFRSACGLCPLWIVGIQKEGVSKKILTHPQKCLEFLW